MMLKSASSEALRYQRPYFFEYQKHRLAGLNPRNKKSADVLNAVKPVLSMSNSTLLDYMITVFRIVIRYGFTPGYPARSPTG